MEEIIIPGATTEEIINKYKNNQKIYSIVGGGEIVGQEIDEKDHLIYVVKINEVISLVHAQNYPVEYIIPQYKVKR